MKGVKLTDVQTWAPRADVAPVTAKTRGGRFTIKANGTRACAGGWQLAFRGIRPGRGYRIRTRARHEGLPNARDCLVAIAHWGEWDREDARPRKLWNYLLPRAASKGMTEFECVARAPRGARRLTVRYVLRWASRGKSIWEPPTIEPADVPERKPVKVCIVNATRQTPERVKIVEFSKGLGLPEDVGESVDLYASLVRAACRKRAQLIVMPEVVVGGRGPAGAVEVPGPATAPFEQLARDHGAHVVVGLRERDGDATRNSAVLIGPAGVLGAYRKVHLAISEGLNGSLPGDSFPVFETPIGRIGCLICMDTTVCESARMTALNGAEFICFPIMGDLRADRFSPGQPVFNESRWKAIMRTRAIDNQLCMVVARNDVKGSCIIDRKGDILAWNEGYEEFTIASVPREDGYLDWLGGDFREITYMLRRPHLYGLYADEACLGPCGRGGDG